MWTDPERAWVIRAGLLSALALSAAVGAADHEQAEVPSPDSAAQEQKAPLINSDNPGNPKPVPQATFEPSEKIRADSSVSFPVDI